MFLDSLDWHRGGFQEVLSSRHGESPAIFRIGDFNLPGMIAGSFPRTIFFIFSQAHNG